MRKIKKIKTTQIVEQTTDIICNKCGQTCSNLKRFHKASPQQMCGFSGLTEIEVHGGYDSQFVGDMTSWQFSLCEKCLSDLVKTFKIPHTIKGDYSSEYVSLKKYNQLAAQALKQNRQEFIKAIREQSNQFTVKDLKTKSQQELYQIYQSLTTTSKK